jgi:hypothetical protein
MLGGEATGPCRLRAPLDLSEEEKRDLVSSTRDLRNRFPGPRGHLFTECFLDERHENRSPGTWGVCAEDFRAPDRKDARAFELDRQFGL